MVTNKYLLQRIFNYTFHCLESCELNQLHYTLIKLILISKSFRNEVMQCIYYPRIIITREPQLECAYNLIIKYTIPLKLSIQIQQQQKSQPPSLIEKFKDKAYSVFNLTERALWNELSPHVESFVSYNNREIKGNGNFLHLKSIEIVNRFHSILENPLLKIINSKFKRNSLIGSSSDYPSLYKLEITEHNTFIINTFTNEMIPNFIIDKITVLSIFLKVDSVQSFQFIHQLKNLRSFSYKNKLLDFQNLFENVNSHQSLDSLYLEFQETKANKGYHDVPFIPFSFLLKNTNLSNLSMKFKDIPIEIVDMITRSLKNLKSLIIIDTQSGDKQAPIETLLEPPKDTCKIDNSTLTHFTFVKSKYKIFNHWIAPSNLKSLCIDQLSPSIFKNHPKVEKLDFICPKGCMNIDNSLFLNNLALNQSIVHLNLDLTTTFYTKQPNYPQAIEFLGSIFNAIPSTNIRHFNFTVRECKNGAFQEYYQELIPVIKKNKTQLYTICLTTINPSVIYPSCQLLEAIIENIHSLQKFETNERIKINHHQYQRLKALIKKSNIKILNIPNVCMDEYINLDSFIIRNGLFYNYDSKFIE
ncbi:hypothetical protein CYY_001964 [Polysphondylium violaceum]|uniref:Uncharacterized protein n=1 Tax=Polysphondylium violaceum TaxID=133409 RepID=A0A8J4Q227_9MYCE|nr:hypothetical protein CYY_001964 [Polysphondylium violaceum]